MPKATYTLVIDQDRSRILTSLLVASQSDPKFQPFIHHYKLGDAYEAFVKELAGKVHELDWCEDPTCENKK